MPPSENKLWKTATHHVSGASIRVLTDEARAYRRLIRPRFAGLRLEPDTLYQLHLLFIYPWRTKKGKIRRWDATNRIKFLQDCIAGFAGIDDCQFKEPGIYERDHPDMAVNWAVTVYQPRDVPDILK